MPRKHADSFGAMDTFQAAGARGRWFRLDRLEAAGLVRLARLPYSVRVLLENVLRNEDGAAFTAEHVRALAAYDARAVPAVEIPFMPARILMQDFTGVPAIVDLAALREAVRRLGGPVEAVNPRVRTDLVIDHSLQVTPSARRRRRTSTSGRNTPPIASATRSLSGPGRASATSRSCPPEPASSTR